MVQPLPPGGELLFSLEAGRGDFIAIVVQQLEVDVDVLLQDATGSVLAHMDTGWGKFGPELVSAIVADEGALTLRIRRLNAGDGGEVRVRLLARHPARPIDRDHAAAVARLAATTGDVTDPEALRRDAEALEQVAAVARSAGDPLLEGMALAVAYRNWKRSGDREKAMAAFDAALPVWGNGGDPWLRAWRHLMLGVDQYERRRHAEALEHYQAARTLWDALGDRRGVALALGQMADCRQWLGDYPLGLDETLETARLWQELGEVYRQVLAVETAAGYRRTLGDIDGALDDYGRALVLARREGFRDLEGEILSLIGVAYRTGGSHERALELFRQALRQMEEIGDHHRVALVQVHIGTTYDNLGDARRARQAFEAAIVETEASGGHQLEIALSRLGGTLVDLDELDEARKALDRALVGSRQKSLRWIEGMVLAQIAELDLRIGRHAAAITGYRKAVEIARSIDDFPRLAQGVLGLAAALRAGGELEESLSAYLEAADLGNRLGIRELLGSAFVGIAGIESERGDLEEALARIQQGVAIFESIRDATPGQELRSLYFAKHRQAYELYVELLLEAERRSPGRGMLGAAFEASDRAHARGLLELLSEARLDPWAGIPAELRAREDRVRRELARVQTELIRERSRPTLATARIELLETELARTMAELEDTELDVELHAKGRPSARLPTAASATDVRRWLPESTVLLEYLTGGDRSHLFVLTRTETASFTLAAEDRLDELVRSVRDGIERLGRLGLSRYRQAAEELYAEIVAPAEELLDGASRLVIIPDGPLHLLPFEVLLTEQADTRSDPSRLPYLVRAWDVAYAPSASILVRLERAAKPRDHGLLAFGDAVYDPDAGEAGTQAPRPTTDAELIARSAAETWPLPRLAGSAAEVESIAALFTADRRTILLRQDATEEAAKTLLQDRSFEVVHFASHALVSNSEPHHSGIVLSLDEDPTEDGLLQTYEILRLRFGAELVVLSACNTGLGQRVKGEGLLGLTRAFLHAGARSTLVSLWRVPDLATAELMTSFYHHLTAGGTASEALRLARLSLIEDSRYAHPHHWAAFVLWGAPAVAVTGNRPAHEQRSESLSLSAGRGSRTSPLPLGDRREQPRP